MLLALARDEGARTAGVSVPGSVVAGVAFVGIVAVSLGLPALSWSLRFPGGVLGVVMVFGWSLVLGALRHLSAGMAAPLVAHFFADLAIASAMLFLVVLPGRA